MTAEFSSPFALNTKVPGIADLDWRSRVELVLSSAREAGLTQDQIVYEDRYQQYFSQLDAIDEQLNQQRYLLDNNEPSAADQWLALVLWLHESVFYALYKTNRQRIDEFANLGHYMRDILGDREWRNSIDFEALKRQYFLENELVNPKQRVPLGSVQLDSPNDRALRFARVSGASDVEEDPSQRKREGEWKRKVSGHRYHITADGSSGYKAKAGRYHLYIANNCPWCHRTAIARQLKRLEGIVSMDVLFYRRDPERGWQFNPEEPGCTADTEYGYRFIRELYERIDSPESSVPILWDRETSTIISNESAEIVRMFDQAFGQFSADTPELYPAALRAQIDNVNTFVYHAINNGAYKAGFAHGQDAYEQAYRKFFDGLETIDYMLRGRQYLLGDRITEADVRLFPTIYRFDAIYHTRFNLGERMVDDIPSLQRWLENMLTIPAIVAASNLDHCRKGYFGRTGNGIVPLGPAR